MRGKNLEQPINGCGIQSSWLNFFIFKPIIYLHRVHQESKLSTATINGWNGGLPWRINIILKLEKEHKIFVIRPSRKVKIKRVEHNKKRIEEQYALGVEDCKAALKALKDYLKVWYNRIKNRRWNLDFSFTPLLKYICIQRENI